MSKFVEELIEDIKSNPKTWIDYYGVGIKKDNIVIYGYGNTRMLSVTTVEINGYSVPTTYFDNWKLEVTIGKWYKKIGLNNLIKTK